MIIIKRVRPQSALSIKCRAIRFRHRPPRMVPKRDRVYGHRRGNRRRRNPRIVGLIDTPRVAKARSAPLTSSAIMVAKIATGEIKDNPTQDGGKNAAAVALRRMGGNARATDDGRPKKPSQSNVRSSFSHGHRTGHRDRRNIQPYSATMPER